MAALTLDEGEDVASAVAQVFAIPELRSRVLRIRSSLMATGWWHVVPERCEECTVERKGGLEGSTPIKWLEQMTRDRWVCDRHRSVLATWPHLHDCSDWIWAAGFGPGFVHSPLDLGMDLGPNSRRAREHPTCTWRSEWPEVSPRDGLTLNPLGQVGGA